MKRIIGKKLLLGFLCFIMLTEVLTVSVFAATPIYTTDNQGTVNYDVNSGFYTASYSGELQADQHLLLVVRKAAWGSGLANLQAGDIMYIDQQGGKTANFTFIPKETVESVVLLTGESSGPIVLGHLLAQTPEYKLGDLNDDTRIDASDVSKLFDAIVKLEDMSDAAKRAADVNEDTRIDTSDVSMLFSYTLGELTSLGKSN